jgi:calcineurin-like phosphoesterase family protein
VSIKSPFFVISDTHFGHKNIIKYCDRPQYHEKLMIANWRRRVKKHDTILHLGDLMMGGNEYYNEFWCNVAPLLTGKKYIILGNHDKRSYDYEALGFTVIKPFSIKYRKHTVSFDHYPKLLNDEDNKTLHVHGHIHNHAYSRNEINRWGNINVSVEVTNYQPRLISRLLNKEITKRNIFLKAANFDKDHWQQTNTPKRAA